MIKGSIRNLETKAIQAITVFDSKPFFFLFADIDKRDSKLLLKVLTIYRNNQISCYYYHTNKGYHVISPCLLTFRKWSQLTDLLRPLLEAYRFDALRISNRQDLKFCSFCDFNIQARFKESATLHRLIDGKFRFIPEIKITKPRETDLRFITYYQLVM